MSLEASYWWWEIVPAVCGSKPETASEGCGSVSRSPKRANYSTKPILVMTFSPIPKTRDKSSSVRIFCTLSPGIFLARMRPCLVHTNFQPRRLAVSRALRNN